VEDWPSLRRVYANILNFSRGQPTRGGPPALELGEDLSTPHREKVSRYEPFTKAADLNWYFGTA
jgi:hypothetical protein